MRFPFSLFLGLLLTSSVFAKDLKLPPNYEIVSQDSASITVKNKDTGISQRLLKDGEYLSHSWEDNRLQTDNPYPTDDTCFYFRSAGNVTGSGRGIGFILFGDANHNGKPEIVGMYNGSSWIYEYSGYGTTYILKDSIYDSSPINYGYDSDGDGKSEFLTGFGWHDGLTLYESGSYDSLSDNRIYSWPYGFNWGVIADIDEDGQIELCIRNTFLLLEVWRSAGDNQYNHAYDISFPDSFGAMFYGYIFGDFDDDGRIEMVATSDLGVILEYEYVAPDSLAQVWMGRVSHYNAFDIVGPTDMDGDGLKEFVVMSISWARGGFYYYFFESTGDNQFVQVAVDSIPGDVISGDGIGLWDFDHDGMDELAFCTAAWAGIFKAFGHNDIRIIYLMSNAPGSQVFVYDSNNNGFGEMVFDGNRTPIKEFIPGRNILGDINCDCSVNLSDPLYLVNYLKGYNNYLPYNNYLADVNGNCQVTGLDVTYFVRYLAGIGPAPRQGDCQ